MSSYLSIGAVCGCIILAVIMFFKFRRLVRAENELETVKQNNRWLESKLDQIVQVQIKLSEIQNEKAPEKKEAPVSGDVDTRLARLNDRVQEQ